MTDAKNFIVDFVAKGSSPDEWRMVLVEEGDWNGDYDEQLRRLQNRLYDCIDAALDGQLAEKFPESDGKSIVVQVDFYDAPQTEVEGFMERFAKNVFSTGDYAQALKASRYVKSLSFEWSFNSLAK